MPLIAEAHGAVVHVSPWLDLLAEVPRCDAIVTDCPYSPKTHTGHDESSLKVGTLNDDGAGRRAISYDAWGETDVKEFVAAWHPRCEGWFCTITDDVLAPVWAAALEAQGRYVFAPLPYVAPGSRVRLSGDGPSAWTCWIVVARPRTREYASWGTLPGAYVLPPGFGERKPIVGGKETWIMARLIEDYSRPGGLIVDPCAGACTTAIGAIRTGRRAVCGDVSSEAIDIGAEWIKHPHGPAPGTGGRSAPGQIGLFSGVGL